MYAVRTPSKSPLKSRSLSDSTPKLAPSPKLKEPFDRKVSQDDNAIPTSSSIALASAAPYTPQKGDQPPFGLHLHMPRRDPQAMQWSSRPPLSPKMERANTSPYTSPQSVLPRRSRGLDFARAATHLHHSTLAEQSSPDTSPAVRQGPMNIPHPRKRSVNAMVVDPPNFGGSYDRITMASSLGSISMIGSDDDTSSDDLEPMDDNEDPDDHILNTPHLHRKSPSVSMTPAPTLWPNPFNSGGNHFSGFRKIKFRDAKSRHSSSSASGNSNVPSPVPTSPGGKTGESSYFPKDSAFRRPPSRRESISKVTNELNISSGNDSGDEGGLPMPSTPGVVRRPVSRRGNLYPKTRAFGRIRAELMEESTPVESEFRREAEVIKQVLESDLAPAPSVTMSSPTFQPIIQSLEGIPEDTVTLLESGLIGPTPLHRTPTALFAHMARSNGTKDFWDNVSEKMTPPPAPLSLRNSSSGEDMMVDSPVVSQSSSAFSSIFPNYAISEPSRSSTPQPPASQSNQQNVHTPQQQHTPTQQPPPTAADALRRSNKRRRDDDLDAMSLKRRAVSPGVSVTNSPVMSQQSPSQRGNGNGGGNGSVGDLWDRALQQQQQQQQQSQSGQLGGVRMGGERERASSISSVVSGTPLLGPKRVGLHGMNDMQGLTEKMTLE
jgi:hypothetical protein